MYGVFVNELNKMTEYTWLSECCDGKIEGGKCAICFEGVEGVKVCDNCGEDFKDCRGKCIQVNVDSLDK